ncbi:unnamed protein product [Pedinophyceae sp. YPF-701]|nr:unnamed protein product [Pedinophyceae sp. YPF-701]
MLREAPEAGSTRPKFLVLDHVSPATRLMEKRRQMFEVAETLELQKAEHAQREEAYKKREEDLKRKDLELQESLIRFSKFLQENDAKRQRALRREQDERKVREEKEREIAALQEDLDKLRATKDEMVTALETRMLQYQAFLEQTLEAADEYHEIADLLARHATLQATNQDLKEQTQSLTRELEQLRLDMNAYVRAKTNEILNLNNEISTLKKDLEQRERACMALEAKKDYSMQIMCQRTLEHGQVCMATDNLFHRCRSRSHISHPTDADAAQQLEVVGNFVSDLGEIVKQWRLQLARKSVTPRGKSPPEEEPLITFFLFVENGADFKFYHYAASDMHVGGYVRREGGGEARKVRVTVFGEGEVLNTPDMTVYANSDDGVEVVLNRARYFRLQMEDGAFVEYDTVDTGGWRFKCEPEGHWEVGSGDENCAEITERETGFYIATNIKEPFTAGVIDVQ